MRRGFFFVIIALAALVFLENGPATQPPLEASTFLQDIGDLSGKNVYFSESNDEASRFDRSEEGLSRYAGLIRQLGAQLHTLEWRRGIPADADLVVIVGPTSDLSDDQVARLWAYLNKGGRILLIIEPTVENFRAFSQNSGLFDLTWEDWGLRSRNDVVVVEAGTHIIQVEPVEETAAEEDIVEGDDPTVSSEIAQIEAPILNTEIITSEVADHPITAGLDSSTLAFSRARSLEVDTSIQDVIVAPLVFSPSDYYGETEFTRYLEEETSDYNTVSDTRRGALLLAAALEDEAVGARMVIIGDLEFATNGYGLVTSPIYSASFVYPGNAQFLLQATAWLLESEVTIPSFPTPAPSATSTPSPTLTPTPGF